MLRVCEPPGEENYQARGREGGLAPWWPPVPRVVRWPLEEAKVVVDLGERGERRGRVVKVLV